MVIIAGAIVLMIIIAIVVLFVDFDRDGLPNYRELSLGTGILTADSDSDDLKDGEEVNTYRTDPLADDSDNDGLQDGEEVNTYGTNPLVPDSDGDGLQDGEEVNTYGTNPLVTDTDNDGLNDGQEVITYQTNPFVADSDNDGLQDGEEVNTYGTNPLAADSDNDGLQDGEEVAIWSTDPLRYSQPPLVTVVPNKTGISAILYFETPEFRSCRVRYGTDANYGRELSEVSTGTQHLVIFPGDNYDVLDPDLEYYYTISASYNGRDVYSSVGTFTPRNAVNNWDSELQKYTVNLFVYFNFNANQDNEFVTWENYLRRAAEWIYDATDGYIRIGTVVMADSPSPSGDFADFDDVADMKIGSFPDTGGYRAWGGAYYGIDDRDTFIELGIYGDNDENDWADDSTLYPWPPPVIAHEFGHYALGLRDEYDRRRNDPPYPNFCTINNYTYYTYNSSSITYVFSIYNSSLMSALGDWSGWSWTRSGTEWVNPIPIPPYNYYSEFCTDEIHTRGTDDEGTDIVNSMWRTLVEGDPTINFEGYRNIPDSKYTSPATPVQAVGAGWDNALDFIIVDF